MSICMKKLSYKITINGFVANVRWQKEPILACCITNNYSCGLSTATIEYSSACVCVSVCVSVCLSVCLSVCVSVCLSVCL